MKKLSRNMLLLGMTAFLVVAGCSSLVIVNESKVSIDEVIKMSQAGVDRDVIIRDLEATHSRFKLKPDEIVQLTENGVDDDIIKAMIASGTTPEPYAWESSVFPYESWVDYRDDTDSYGHRYHSPNPNFMSSLYMSPHVTYRQPSLIGSFYHYIPLGGTYSPYSDYFRRLNQEQETPIPEDEER